MKCLVQKENLDVKKKTKQTNLQKIPLSTKWIWLKLEFFFEEGYVSKYLIFTKQGSKTIAFKLILFIVPVKYWWRKAARYYNYI